MSSFSWQCPENLAVSADNVSGKTSGHKTTRAFVVRIPNVPSRNIPTIVHLLRGTLLSSRIAATTLNVCEHNGDSICFSGDVPAYHRCWRLCVLLTRTPC